VWGCWKMTPDEYREWWDWNQRCSGFGPGMWGFGTPSPAAKVESDTDIEDTVRERIETWDRERQIIAYKMLHAIGHRIGQSMDYELNELRRQRHKAAKEA
jgi:hypothetical protein